MSFIKAAVLGHPIKHTKSPLIHNYWIRKYGQQGSYEAVDIAPEKLGRGIVQLIGEGFSGFNLTVPHKEVVLQFCDALEDGADKIGAVNTVVITDGKILGRNTDIFGFTQNIKENAPGFAFAGKTALVLGSGGAARAVVAGLQAEKVDRILIANRTDERAHALKKQFSGGRARIEVVNWDRRADALKDIDLLVNTTALGMNGQPRLDLDLRHLPTSALVNDIVYAPLETELLQNAKDHGAQIVTGIGMLLHQARPAFKAWFGMKELPEVTKELQELVLR